MCPTFTLGGLTNDRRENRCRTDACARARTRAIEKEFLDCFDSASVESSRAASPRSRFAVRSLGEYHERERGSRCRACSGAHTFPCTAGYVPIGRSASIENFFVKMRTDAHSAEDGVPYELRSNHVSDACRTLERM